MNDKKKMTMISVFFSILFLGTSVYLWVQKEPTKEQESKEVLLKKEDTEKVQEKTIFVDIKGEVAHPGIYEVPENQRVMDIITAAGGLTALADTSGINLSKKVEDQMVIIVDKVGTEEKKFSVNNDARIDSRQAISSKKKSDTSQSSIVSINNSSKEELMTLSGIGSSKAEAIISYRNSHGGFKTIEELLEVKGIGDSVFNKIKDNITL